MELQTSADVVIIGGGIFGCATAYYLAQRNVDVVLLDKGPIGNEQSTRAWAYVRQQGRDMAELPMMVASNRIWRELSAELDADIEWKNSGLLATAQSEEQLDGYRSWMRQAEELGIKLDTRIVSPAEIAEMLPDMHGHWVGGMYTPSDGHAEPTKVVPALARAAIREGATIHTHCAAEGFEVTDGRITAVHTERGTIKTPVVVCAAGAWSRTLARMVDLSLPQIVVRNTAVQTAPAPPITDMGVVVRGAGLAFRQRTNGTVNLGTLERSVHELTFDSLRYAKWFLPNFLKNRSLFRFGVSRELIRDIERLIPLTEARRHPFRHSVEEEPKPDMLDAQKLYSSFVSAFPHLKGLKVRRVWAGNIDSTPDAVPVLGEVNSPRGFIFATGFSGHGFALGPIVGQVLSDLIVDGEPSMDIAPLSYHRFTEGEMAPAREVI